MSSAARRFGRASPSTKLLDCWCRHVRRFIVQGVGRRVAFTNVGCAPVSKNFSKMFVAYPATKRRCGIVRSSFRDRGITDTEIHFHLFAIVNVKWLSDMRVINEIRSQIWCTPCSEADSHFIGGLESVCRGPI